VKADPENEDTPDKLEVDALSRVGLFIGYRHNPLVDLRRGPVRVSKQMLNTLNQIRNRGVHGAEFQQAHFGPGVAFV
jgi:hypothetical protein